MKKTEAIREASEALLIAATTTSAAIQKLGRINRECLSDGAVSHVIRQIRKLGEVSKELSDLANGLDWEVDETKTIAAEKAAGEETN